MNGNRQQKAQPILLFCTVIALVISVLVIAYTRTLATEERIQAVYALSFMQLLLAGGTYLWIRKTRLSALRASGFGWRMQMARMAVAGFILIVALLLVYAMTLSSQVSRIDIATLIWLIFYQIVLISMVEEMIFRGLIFASLPEQSLQAILVSSILFSCYHWNNGLMALPYYFAIGMVFAVFRHFHLSLYTLTIGHALFNIVLQVLLPSAGFRFGSGAFYAVMPLAFFALACLAGWILSHLKMSGKPIAKQEDKEKAISAAV